MTKQEAIEIKARAWDLMTDDEERLDFTGALEYMNRFLHEAAAGRSVCRLGRLMALIEETA